MISYIFYFATEPDSTSESNENSREMDLSKLPIKVFDKNVVGSKISEKEMKRDIKLYLDTDAVLSKKRSIMKIKLMKINN